MLLNYHQLLHFIVLSVQAGSLNSMNNRTSEGNIIAYVRVAAQCAKNIHFFSTLKKSLTSLIIHGIQQGS
jgi:hypothetical protein